MADTSYNGVQFTPAQQKILNDDLALIDQIEKEIRDLDNEYNGWENVVNEARQTLDGWCNNYNGKQRSNCISEANGKWEAARNRQTSIVEAKNIKNNQLVAAKKNYNDDLSAIQNQIKFQIQASVANSTSNTQAASNTVAVNNSDPRVLLQKAEADAAAKIKAIELQATLDKQKRDSQVKLVGFSLLTVTIIVLGYLTLKRLGVF